MSTAADTAQKNGSNQTTSNELDTEGLEVVQRVAKLPGIESAVNLTSGLYGKIKESNIAFKFLFGTAEHTVHKAVEYVQPIATQFEKPIKTVDSMMCTTLDVVESKVPIIKKTTDQIYQTTTTYLPIEPVLEHTIAAKNFGIQKVNDLRNNIQENLYTSFGESKKVQQDQQQRCDKSTQTSQ